jgi:hypothetical protein
MSDLASKLRRAIENAEERAGTSPARSAVKLRPADWDHVRRTGRKAAAEITRLQKELETTWEALRMISVEAKEPNEPIGRSVFKALATCGEIADLALKDKETSHE